MMKIIFLLILSFNVYAQKIIECNENFCDTNFTVEEQLERLFYSAINLGVNNQDNIVITSEPENERSIRLYVENNNPDGQSIHIDLDSETEQYSSPDVMLIGDFFNSININVNGYQGIDGKASSEICAEEYAKGELGVFGQKALEDYNERRLFDLTIPNNQCTFVDVKYLLDNNFSCDQEDFEEIDANNPSVIVERFRGKNKCIGLSYMDICLAKTIEVTCTWRIKYTDPPTVAGQFSNGENYPDVHTKVFRMSEQEYLSQIGDSSRIQYFCENLSYNPFSGSPPEDIVVNGNFFFDLRNWTTNNMSWNNEQMKLNGGLNSEGKSTASQVLPTIPGRKYRVRGEFLKATEHEYVSGGSVFIWNNVLKDTLIEKESIFEKGAIKGVFLTSDQAPYHFGYLFENTNSAMRSFTITNRDDRTAINCSPPYLDGDSDDFNIVSDFCGEQDLAPNESCTINLRARPQTVGSKTAYIKRICRDDYGNELTQLNEKVQVLGWKNYYQVNDINGDPTGSYIDGYYWKRGNVGNGAEWLRCVEDSDNGKNCFSSAPSINEQRGTESGIFYPGYNPPGLLLPETLPTPDSKTFPIVLNSEINVNDRFNLKNFDFIFTATSNQTLIELSSILKYNTGYFNTVIVEELDPTAGPDIKPPEDLQCPDPANTPGCLAGELGNGYYELFGQTVYEETSPGFDSTFYTIPDGSDWRIRYVDINQSCPQYFTKIKTEHLASNIGYDDNDELCDDVSIPEDPTGDIIDWQFVGFERKAEFGTELIECRLGDCLVDSSVRNLERNLLEINPGSGSNGSQQGSGLLFIYDYDSYVGTAQNGSGGTIGALDLEELEEDRICVNVKDASNQSAESIFSIDPVVEFRRYTWKPLKIKETGNFGRDPENNGKEINIYRKMDSSVRYYLQKVLF